MGFLFAEPFVDFQVNNRIIPLLLFIGFAFGSFGNNAPVITSLTAEPETTPKLGTVLLTCNAHDEEDNTFVYTWDCTLGTIVGDGNTATWTAPNETGVFSISCEVMDSDDGNAIETIDIVVL